MATPLLAGDPRQLGSFYLDGRLGAGGFGVVYEGYGADGGRVAVKTLHRVEHGDRDLLREEVRAWLLVEPVCIAKVLQVDFDGPIPFVVSEHVAGPDLQEAVNRNGPYEPEELRRLAVGVAAALVAVGQAGVVHRDVKPANVLLGADGPRVIDFGIARIGALPSTNGVVKGTLRYMPPERYRGERGDAKVDVWAWGAVVWFAANGHHAFGGRSLPEIHHQVVTHEPDTSMLEEPLRSLVAAALSKDPAHRPTARELLSELTGGTDPVAAAAQAVPTRAPEVAAPPRGEVAEAVFARLDPREQEAVPAVLLRMVASGERAEDTLRSAHRSEFADDRTDPQVLERVLGAFTDAGILVWQEETATLCSAALVRAWPRLREWVRTERQSLGTHQSIAAASRRWEEHGRKNSDLYQGTALADALSWASRGRRHLTPNHAERAFLDAGAALERRRGRRRTVLSAVLAVLLVVAVGAAAVAVDRGRNLERQRDRAASAQVAGLAQSLRRTNPELARRLAVAAAGLADTPESRSGLLALRHQWEDQAVKLPDFEVTASDLDATARVLGVAGGAVGRGSVQVEFWNLDTRKRISSYTAASAVGDIALSGDGRTAAVTTGDGRTRLIDTAAGRPRDARTYPSARGQYGPVVKLSPLGTYLLVGELAKDSDGRDVRVLAVWDTRRAKKVLTASGGMFPDVNASVSPDERIISVPVSSGKGRPFTWIDTRSGKKLPVPGLDLEPGDAQGPVTFSTDGRLAAVKIDGGKIRVFDRNGTGYPDHLLSNTNPDSSHPLTFSKDGRYFAQGAFVWDTRALYNPPIMRYPTPQGECHPDEGGLRLTAEASELRCVGGDGVFRSLDISVFTKARVLAEGRSYGTSGVNEDRTAVGLKRGALLELWSTRTWTNRATWDASEHRMSAITVSSDTRLLAGLTAQRTKIEIWDVARKARLGTLTTPLLGQRPSRAYLDFAFSPDGRSMAVYAITPDGNHTLAFWNLTTMRPIRSISARIGCFDQEQAIVSGDGSSLLFRPDGKAVIAAPCMGLVEFPSGRILAKGAPGLRIDGVSDDGRTLYSFPRGGRPYIRFWDARTLRPKGEDLRTGPVESVEGEGTAVSPDGRLFATVHATGTSLYDSPQIKVWDTRTRRQMGVPLTGPVGGIAVLTFTPDGSALVSVDKQGRVTTHGIAPSRLLRELCAKSGPLSESQWKAHIPDVPYRKTC